jgi:hypothetical protein
VNRQQCRAAAASVHGGADFTALRTAGVFQITDAVALNRLIAAASSIGFVGRVELLRAVRNREIALLELDRTADVPSRVLREATRPLIALLGDDDYANTGPSGWAAVLRLSRWARAAMIHATGADVPSYRAAIRMALLVRLFLLIETDSAHAQEWGNALLAWGVPFLGLVPSEGAHPILPQQAKMQ